MSWCCRQRQKPNTRMMIRLRRDQMKRQNEMKQYEMKQYEMKQEEMKQDEMKQDELTRLRRAICHSSTNICSCASCPSCG